MLGSDFAKITDPVNPKSYSQKIIGWLPGLILSLDDPEKLGRVQVTCPLIEPNVPLPNDSDGWVPVVTPYALNNRDGGMLFPLEVGTQVVLLPMMGDINHLCVIGCFHSRVDRPYEEFDRSKGITGEYSRAGRIHLLDDSETGKGAEVKVYPSGLVEKVDPQGNKTIQSEDGAVLQIKKDGGIRMENKEGAIALDPKGNIQQFNQSSASFSIDTSGTIKLESPTSPSLILSKAGIDMRSQKDEVSDIKQGLEKSLSGAFGSTFTRGKEIQNLLDDLKNGRLNRSEALLRFRDITLLASQGFDRYYQGNDFLNQLQNFSNIELGQRTVDQLDHFRENGLDNVFTIVKDMIEGDSDFSGQEILEVLFGELPTDISGYLNLGADVIEGLLSGENPLDDVLDNLLEQLLPNGSIDDIGSILNLGLSTFFGSTPLVRSVVDIFNGVLDGDLGIEDFTSVLKELGIANDLINNIGGIVSGITDFLDEGLALIEGAFDMVTGFLDNIDGLITEFIGFPLPFSLGAIISQVIQSIGILDQISSLIDQLKGMIDEVEGLIGKFIELKQDTSLAESIGDRILSSAEKLSESVNKQKDLDPFFQEFYSFAQALLKLEFVDSLEEMTQLAGIVENLDSYKLLDLSKLKVNLKDPSLNNANLIKKVDEFLDGFVKNYLPGILADILKQIDLGALKIANKNLLETVNSIATVHGGTMHGDTKKTLLSANSYNAGGLVEMDKKSAVLSGAGGKRGFGAMMAVDDNKAVLKAPGADLGLGNFLEMDMGKTTFHTAGASKGLGSSLELQQKEISIQAPGAKNNAGSWINLNQDQIKLHGPGGEKGLGSNIIADLNFLELSGPSESNNSRNHAFINLTPELARINAPGGAIEQGSTFWMKPGEGYWRAGSEVLGSAIYMTPSSIFWRVGTAGAFVSMLPGTLWLAPPGQLGIFMTGPLIFIN